MAQFDRQKARNRLNKQKSRLKSKGANPAEISAYFGVNYSVKFGDLSNSDLKSLIDKLNNTEPVTVKDGFIYPTRYLNARKIFFADSTTQPIVNGYEKALKSPFISKDKSLKETRMRFNELEASYRSLYADAFRQLGLPDLAKQVSKLKVSDLKRFIEYGQGKLDLDSLYDGTPTTGDPLTDINLLDDQDEQINQQLKQTVSKLWDSYNKSRPRRLDKEK